MTPLSRLVPPCPALPRAVGMLVLVLALTPLMVRAGQPPKRVAAVTTAYYHNSHADVLVSRLLQSDTLDGQGEFRKLKLVSLYTDQVPENDISRRLSAEYEFPIYDNVADALTLGTDQLAVDGVLLIAEHGKYPESPTGQIVYPKRRLFEQIVQVFRQTGDVVPVFCDKHLADNWQDAKWIYDAADELGIPLMAGSSLPVLWRYPPLDVPRDAPLRQMVAVSYHRLDAYGFHALEMIQSLVERRRGGETGVRAVECLEGDAVWEAGRQGRYDRRLLEQALARLKERPLPADKSVEELAKHPVLFLIHYRDGLQVSVLTLNHAVVEWAAAWQYEDGRTHSTLFWTQEARPFMHFTYLLQGIEQMVHSGRATWPVERTLLTSGTLDALLVSRMQGGKLLKTPQLEFAYQSPWDWQQPPPPPAGRPIREQ